MHEHLFLCLFLWMSDERRRCAMARFIYTHTRRLDLTIGARQNAFTFHHHDAKCLSSCLIPGVLVNCRRGCEDVPGIIGIRETQPRRIRATAACEITSVV